MYWWNIHALKKELMMGPLPSSAACGYLVFFVLGATLPGSGHQGNTWKIAGEFAQVVVAIIGTLACYEANGGPKGQDFLGRYLSIIFVVGIRFLLPVLGVILFLVLVHFLLKDFEVTPLDALLGLVFNCIFYWRTAYHIRSLHSETGAQNETKQFDAKA
jgi:hypothetical protein